jgi:hypothetical protein
MTKTKTTLAFIGDNSFGPASLDNPNYVACCKVVKKLLPFCENAVIHQSSDFAKWARSILYRAGTPSSINDEEIKTFLSKEYLFVIAEEGGQLSSLAVELGANYLTFKPSRYDESNLAKNVESLLGILEQIHFGN